MKLAVPTLLALLLASYGCSHDATSAVDPPPAAPAIAAAQLAYLKVEPATVRPTPDLDELIGTVDFDERHTARLNPIVGGRVAELLVQVGDHVTADQPLIALDSADVKAAQADFVRAQADATVAAAARARAERLRGVGAIAAKDVLQANEDDRKAAADLARARAQLERLRVGVNDPSPRYILRAPFAGTVVERRAVVGMDASGGAPDPLVVVADLSTVRVVVRVPARQLRLVHVGQSVAVRVDGDPEPLTGSVTAIGDVADDATQTVPVRCLIPNSAHRLKPAMFARVSLHAADATPLVSVPTTALVSDGRRFRVVVQQPDQSYALRDVEIGAELGDHVEIIAGLAAAEPIVVEGALLAARALEPS